jgi:beta-lactamase class A
MRKKIIIFFLFVVALAAGGTIGIFGYRYITSCKVKYLFINSNLSCDGNQTFDKSNPITLKDKISTYIDSKKTSGDLSQASVYFRDLKDGPTLGINEDDLYISASLLKLPIALTLYKLSEDGKPDILNQDLEFKVVGDPDGLVQYFKPKKTPQVGSVYKISELIFDSLVYSDNLSNDILKSYLTQAGNGQDLILSTLKDLGLVEPATVSANDISTRAYASIFRQLFNASYLSNKNSETILNILSQSDFDSGIAAGVPTDIKVANKFGERDLINEKQLHDCGIVYFPGNPYLVCVMTRGKDYDTLASVISDISKMVYGEMLTRSKGR